MPTSAELRRFDRKIRELTGESPSARPFLCEGLPFGCNVFLVGTNPGKTTGFWQRWSAKTGCDKRRWLEDYLSKHARYSPTRQRIEILIKALGTIRCLETNVLSFPSPRESDLAASQRDTRLLTILWRESVQGSSLLMESQPSSTLLNCVKPSCLVTGSPG